jgi:hypothetical protein
MNGWAGRGAQAVEKLPSKHKAKFKPNTTKKKKKDFLGAVHVPAIATMCSKRKQQDQAGSWFRPF